PGSPGAARPWAWRRRASGGAPRPGPHVDVPSWRQVYRQPLDNWTSPPLISGLGHFSSIPGRSGGGMTARLLVSGARVLTPGGEWPRGWITVDGRKIAAMGQGEPPPGAGDGADLLAADGLVAVPGFI